MTTNFNTLKSFFAFCSVFSQGKDKRKKDGNDFQTDTVCPVSKILQRYVKELKLTVLLVLTE